jgi:enoyl-CoA hydratase/carnithine racemase
MTMERVSCTIRDGVADVRLNRPDKLNALDLAMFGALAATGDRLRDDPTVRAVVISGEGRGFCAGLDISMFSQGLPIAASSDGAGTGLLDGRGGGRIDNNAQRVAWTWHEMEVPVIAALHGVVFGGGIQIALGADLRIAAPDTRLSVMEVRWGLVPDMTGTYSLPRTVGIDVAKELTWTGRVVEGPEALRLGLVTRLSDDPRGEALALAGEVAARNPDAIRLAKQLLDGSLSSDPATQLMAEEAAARHLVGTQNQQEAVAASFEKRPARFI